MVIDASALVAVSQKEEGYLSILIELEKRKNFLSAASLQELYVVIYTRKRQLGWNEMDALLTFE